MLWNSERPNNCKRTIQRTQQTLKDLLCQVNVHTHTVYMSVGSNKVTICFQPRPLVEEECEVSECIGRRERSVKTHTKIVIDRVCVCAQHIQDEVSQSSPSIKCEGSGVLFQLCTLQDKASWSPTLSLFYNEPLFQSFRGESFFFFFLTDCAVLFGKRLSSSFPFWNPCLWFLLTTSQFFHMSNCCRNDCLSGADIDSQLLIQHPILSKRMSC